MKKFDHVASFFKVSEAGKLHQRGIALDGHFFPTN